MNRILKRKPTPGEQIKDLATNIVQRDIIKKRKKNEPSPIFERHNNHV